MLEVCKNKFLEIIEGYSAETIMANGRAKAGFVVQGKKVVCTGGQSSGEKGWYLATVWEYQPLQQYKGDLEPLEYSKHNDEVTDGKRERCYRGMKVKLDGQWIVFVGQELRLTPVEQSEQLRLF